MTLVAVCVSFDINGAVAGGMLSGNAAKKQKTAHVCHHLHALDRDDYQRVLNEQGMTQEYITAITENLEDQIPAPDPQAPYRIGESYIQGSGILVTANILSGEQVAIMRVKGKRTPAGRYANHSSDPNCEVVIRPNGDFVLIARCSIAKGDEATVSYRQVIAVKEALCHG